LSRIRLGDLILIGHSSVNDRHLALIFYILERKKREQEKKWDVVGILTFRCKTWGLRKSLVDLSEIKG